MNRFSRRDFLGHCSRVGAVVGAGMTFPQVVLGANGANPALPPALLAVLRSVTNILGSFSPVQGARPLRWADAIRTIENAGTTIDSILYTSEAGRMIATRRQSCLRVPDDGDKSRAGVIHDLETGIFRLHEYGTAFKNRRVRVLDNVYGWRVVAALPQEPHTGHEESHPWAFYIGRNGNPGQYEWRSYAGSDTVV